MCSRIDLIYLYMSDGLYNISEASSFLWTPVHGSNHIIGCCRPHTSLSNASLGLWGRYGPDCCTCSMYVSSPMIAWICSTKIADTNIPNRTLSSSKIMQCSLENEYISLNVAFNK